jgi:hypothetical protein
MEIGGLKSRNSFLEGNIIIWEGIDHHQQISLVSFSLSLSHLSLISLSLSPSFEILTIFFLGYLMFVERQIISRTSGTQCYVALVLSKHANDAESGNTMMTMRRVKMKRVMILLLSTTMKK